MQQKPKTNHSSPRTRQVVTWQPQHVPNRNRVFFFSGCFFLTDVFLKIFCDINKWLILKHQGFLTKNTLEILTSHRRQKFRVIFDSVAPALAALAMPEVVFQVEDWWRDVLEVVVLMGFWMSTLKKVPPRMLRVPENTHSNAILHMTNIQRWYKKSHVFFFRRNLWWQATWLKCCSYRSSSIAAGSTPSGWSHLQNAGKVDRYEAL